MLMQIYFCSSKNKTPSEVHDEEKWFELEDEDERNEMIRELDMQTFYRVLHWFN